MRAHQLLNERFFHAHTYPKKLKIPADRNAPYRHFLDKNSILCAIAVEGFKKLTKSYQLINQDSTIDSLNKLEQINAYMFEQEMNITVNQGTDIQDSQVMSYTINSASPIYSTVLISPE